MLSNDEKRFLRAYSECFLAWRRVVTLPAIKAIEQRKWGGRLPSIVTRQRVLTSSLVPGILLPLALGGKPLALGKLAAAFRDVTAENVQRDSNKEEVHRQLALRRGKERLARICSVLEDYELVRLCQEETGRKTRLVKAGPALDVVLKEFISEVEDIVRTMSKSRL